MQNAERGRYARAARGALRGRYALTLPSVVNVHSAPLHEQNSELCCESSSYASFMIKDFQLQKEEVNMESK